MAELANLKKDISDTICIYPYREIGDDEWPVYTSTTGEEVEYPKAWREVGYICLYPTVDRLQMLRDKSTGGYQISGGKKAKGLKMAPGNVKDIINYVTGTLIKGIVGIEVDGEPIQYSTFSKELADMFHKSNFLYLNFTTAYRFAGGKINNPDEETEEHEEGGGEGFLDESEESSSPEPTHGQEEFKDSLSEQP